MADRGPRKRRSSHHDADATRWLDERYGYRGALIRNSAPYLLFEEGVRNRIIQSLYWKEQCFGLNAATLCDRAANLTYIGGTYENGLRASPFICLAFKMLQLDIEDEIIDEYLSQTHFKYLTALAAFYVRVTSERPEEVYRRLEPLYLDRRKLRRRMNQGFRLTFVDEWVDDLLVKDRVAATSLWRLTPRNVLEDDGALEPRESPLAYMLESDEEKSEEGGERDDKVSHLAITTEPKANIEQAEQDDSADGSKHVNGGGG